MAAPVRVTVLSLYKHLLREGEKITDYNFRLYAVRRTRDAFKQNKGLSESTQIQALVQKAQENLAMLKRQAVVSQMYGSPKVVVESQQTSSS